MPQTEISSEDRQAIYALLRRYAWCIDRSDGDGVASTFTRDGVLELPAQGTRCDGQPAIREWAANLKDTAGFAGRQHHVQPLFVEIGDDGYRLTSYFMIHIWRAGEPSPNTQVLGYYDDVCVREDGEWRFKRKVINGWP